MAQSNYQALLDPVLAWIDSHREEALADLQRFCRQPSIAAQDLGMEEMAAIVTDSLQALGAGHHSDYISVDDAGRGREDDRQ